MLDMLEEGRILQGDGDRVESNRIEGLLEAVGLGVCLHTVFCFGGELALKFCCNDERRDMMISRRAAADCSLRFFCSRESCWGRIGLGTRPSIDWTARWVRC